MRAATFLGMQPDAFESKYVFRTRKRIRLRVPRDASCHFLNGEGCGIHPAKPGFGSVLIEPHLGVLKRVNAAMPVPKGIVEVQYVRSAEALDAEITLPAGVSGEIVWNGHKSSLHSGSQKLKLH